MPYHPFVEVLLVRLQPEDLPTQFDPCWKEILWGREELMSLCLLGPACCLAAVPLQLQLHLRAKYVYEHLASSYSLCLFLAFLIFQGDMVLSLSTFSHLVPEAVSTFI